MPIDQINLWGTRPDPNQLELLSDRVLRDQQEPAPPAPGPIRVSQDLAEGEGWIPECSPSCLYVSAGTDTRPFTYLRPEVLADRVVPEGSLPRFFVLVDRDRPRSTREMALEFDDGRTRIETIESRPVEDGPWRLASLLRITVTSDRYPPREYAVLRIKCRNERFLEEALAEEWSPHWYIGIRDGCRLWRNASPCTNVVSSPDSIPFQLGVKFWLTDHLWDYELTDYERRPIHPFGYSVPVAGGRHLRQLFTWRRWPTVGWGTDRWVSLFKLDGSGNGAAAVELADNLA